MPQAEILIYSDVYDWIASDVVTQLGTVGNSDVTVRFLSDGGGIEAGWAMLTKLNELKGKKTFKNDGKANSMCAFAFAYNKGHNQGTDVCSFGLHRAAFWNEDNLTSEDTALLKDKNDKLRAALEARIDVAKFTERTKVTLDDLFAMPGRVEVRMNADDALYCGLIDEVTQLTPSYQRDISVNFNEISAKFSPNKLPITPTAMTIEEIKSKHRDVYNAIFALGKKKGVTDERDRVGAFIANLDNDKVKAIEAIKTGAKMSQTLMAEFTQSAIASATVKGVESDNAPDVKTAATDPSAKAAEKTAVAEFKNELFAKLNLKKVA